MDIERTMQFIVDQQAQFWASVQKHDEEIAALRASAAKNDAQIATVTDLLGRLAQAEIRLVEQVRSSEARTAEQLRNQETRLAALETASAQFFARMDRYLQGHEGNGNKPQSS